jgi:hypothetical protein
LDIDFLQQSIQALQEIIFWGLLEVLTLLNIDRGNQTAITFILIVLLIGFAQQTTRFRLTGALVAIKFC